jgi:hypothetical protein
VALLTFWYDAEVMTGSYAASASQRLPAARLAIPGELPLVRYISLRAVTTSALLNPVLTSAVNPVSSS